MSQSKVKQFANEKSHIFLIVVVGEGVQAGVVQHKRVVAVLQKVQGAVGDVDSEENLGINVCACFMEVSTPYLGYEQGHHYKLVPLDSVLQLWVDAGADVPVPTHH